MCSDTSSHLESIQDFVLNEDKIVTYRWLSKKLNIHANTCKQLLYMFAKKESEKKLLVSYVVSGSTKDGLRVVVVPEEDLEKVKSSLDSVLSEHVYSVQKSMSCFSSSHLYLAHSYPSSSTINCRLSSISVREVEEREMKPSRVAKHCCLPSVSTCTATVPNSAPTTSTPNNQLKVPVSKSPVKESAVSPSKNNSLVVSPTKNRKKKGGEIKGVGGGIGALLSKQAERNKSQPLLLTLPNNPQQIKQTSVDEETVEHNNKDVDEEITQAVLQNNSPLKALNKTPTGNKNKQTKVRNKKRKSNKVADDTPARKRKRIVIASDSESEENEEDDYMEEEAESPEDQPPETVESDDDEVIPPTPLGESIKPRIRKQIDKTFVDDDGFVITKKQYVYVSGSEDEGKDGEDKDKLKHRAQEKEKAQTTTPQVLSKENQTKSNKNEAQSKGKSDKKTVKEKNKSPEKRWPVSGRKQTSIMNFFKKN